MSIVGLPAIKSLLTRPFSSRERAAATALLLVLAFGAVPPRPDRAADRATYQVWSHHAVEVAAQRWQRAAPAAALSPAPAVRVHWRHSVTEFGLPSPRAPGAAA